MSSDPEIRVQKLKNAKKYQLAYVVFTFPDMRLHEDATLWLAEIALRNSHTHQRNMAYGICHWLNFCIASDIDYRRACIINLINYQQAMSSHISGLTYRPLSSGTIFQRVRLVSEFYEAGIKLGWNISALETDDVKLQKTKGSRPSPATKNVIPIRISSAKISPRNQRTKTDIRPLSPHELNLLLNELCPESAGSPSHSTRDRLIAEWLLFCGLRIHEVLGSPTVHSSTGLNVDSILSTKDTSENPFGHSLLRIIGKSSMARSIAAPNWLIEKTKTYIKVERAASIYGSAKEVGEVFVNAAEAGPFRGLPLSIRRYQSIFSKACLKCGLTKRTKIFIGDAYTYAERAKHSPHDLRHTFAVMNYHAETALGNSEPWKLIQAQMGHKCLKTTVDTYLSFVSLHGDWRDVGRMSMRELAGVPA